MREERYGRRVRKQGARPPAPDRRGEHSAGDATLESELWTMDEVAWRNHAGHDHHQVRASAGQTNGGQTEGMSCQGCHP